MSFIRSNRMGSAGLRRVALVATAAALLPLTGCCNSRLAQGVSYVDGRPVAVAGVIEEGVAPVETRVAAPLPVALDDLTSAQGVTVTGCADRPPPPPCDRPPNAAPGEAWCRVWIPPQHQTRMRRVMAEPSRTLKRWVPAVYDTFIDVECVSGPKVREQLRPATFTSRRRSVMTSPERTITKRVKTKDACGCGQEVCTTETCPAQFEDVCEQVCESPSRLCIEFTPGQYRAVPRKIMVTPARCEEIKIPARYVMKGERVCVTPGRWAWRRNPTCEVPVGLPALQVELIDQKENGEEAGIFAIGETVRYELLVTHDQGSESMADMRIIFTLPPELEYVGGTGQEITVEGSGQSARTGFFILHVGDVRKLHLLARVVGVSDNNLIQLTASVQGSDGNELARETESTTVKPASVLAAR